MTAAQPTRERTVTLALPHSQMCLLRAALRWCEGSLYRSPAMLQPSLEVLDALRSLRQSPAWDRAFDAAVKREATDA